MGTILKLLRSLVDGEEYRRRKIAQVVKNEFFTVNVHRVYRCLIAVEHIWVERGVVRTASINVCTRMPLNNEKQKRKNDGV